MAWYGVSNNLPIAPRHGHTFTSFNNGDSALLLGGEDSSGRPMRDAFVLDLSTETRHKKKSHLPHPLWEGAAHPGRPRRHEIQPPPARQRGVSSGTHLPHRGDLGQPGWQLPPPPHPPPMRVISQEEAAWQQVYVFGGWNGSVCTNDHYVLDLGTWISPAGDRRSE